MRPTTYRYLHDEFYCPAGANDDLKSIRRTGFNMGVKGLPVSEEMLRDRATLYHGHLNAALHTIDQRADVVERRAFDPFRNISLFVLAIVGLGIFALALTVDYRILHDFWTVVYSNEFLEVPESLQDNVAFKSLQVLFAVIAIHFLISHVGPIGRGVFMALIGVMVVGMLVGLGFLSTKTTLPDGATLFGEQITRSAATEESNDEVLESLGLRPSTAVTEAGGEKKSALFNIDVPRTDIDSIETLVFFGTFGLIFLFVSSVGALCLHYSLHSLNALFGGAEPERREHAVAWHHMITQRGEWRPKTRKDLSDQRQRIRHAQRLIGDPKYRSQLMQDFINQFAAGYMEGLTERGRGVRSLFAGSGGREEMIALRDDMRVAVESARGEWTPDAVADLLPDDELRHSLGYKPDRGGLFGAIGRLFSRGRSDEVEPSTSGRMAPPPPYADISGARREDRFSAAA